MSGLHDLAGKSIDAPCADIVHQFDFAALSGSKRTAVPAGMFRRMPRVVSRSNTNAELVSKK